MNQCRNISLCRNELSQVLTVTEDLRLRAERTFTNVLNHANLDDPNLNFTSGSFGKITSAHESDFAGSQTGLST
jgi:hypothetical protein